MKPLRKLVEIMTGIPESNLRDLKAEAVKVDERSCESTRQLEEAFRELDATLVRVGKNVSRAH